MKRYRGSLFDILQANPNCSGMLRFAGGWTGHFLLPLFELSKMKKYIFLGFLLIISYTGFGQFDHAGIMLGKTDSVILIYIDSLDHLIDSSFYKLKKEITKEGNLLITVYLSVEDEHYYKCVGYIFFFEKKNDLEICTRQVIVGTRVFSPYNLAYLNDNFTKRKKNRWEKPYAPDDTLKITAHYEEENDQYQMYKITYLLVKGK